MELPRLKTIEEVANYLHLKREILQKLCREEIPLFARGPILRPDPRSFDMIRHFGPRLGCGSGIFILDADR
jgi:hypothetical protein